MFVSHPAPVPDHGTRRTEWRVVWFEHSDSTTMAPWVTALLGLLVMVAWSMMG